jgi:UDP-N-acetylglucosamine--N-acetylmuramyl-(pentapeptide) pyrophosphoryl-undecaprenol N-acetylglucosamine transferase
MSVVEQRSVGTSNPGEVGEESPSIAPEPSPVCVLIAASSTGGHLIPALHIANAIRERAPGARVEFIGAGKPLEESLIVNRGYVRHIIAASGVKRMGIKGLLTFCCTFPKALLQLHALFSRVRPDVVVGVGGYVSVLPVVLARLKGIPTWAHEAEKYPGLANRVLAYFNKNFSVAFEGTKLGKSLHVTVTGHPVRQELRAVDRFTTPEGPPKHLLILGGSQGARGLDTVVQEIAPILKERQIEVVHQSRPESLESVAATYKSARISAHVVSFIEDMPGAYQWADFIISRAGAGTVAEIGCVNRPTIFVPYPYQQGTHQTDNAKTLVAKEKALLVEETLPDFPRRLGEAIAEVTIPANYRRMKEAPFESGGLEAARKIAEGVLSLTPHNKGI